jgi:hypothetical protein
MDEPCSKYLFDFTFEDKLINDRGNNVRSMMYEEMLLYRGSGSSSGVGSKDDDDFMDCDTGDDGKFSGRKVADAKDNYK